MGAMEAGLRGRWAAVAGTSRAAAALFDGVLARYREPQRRYHTVKHLAVVLEHVEVLLTASAPSLAGPDADAARMAAWLHDVVYDPTAAPGVNEAASAAFGEARLAALGWTPPLIERVGGLVLVTATHETGDDPAAGVVVDADLAVLGDRPAVYDAYVRGVRAEYAFIDDDGWRLGRAAVLRSFLDRPAIYATPTMRAAREARARANLTAELAALRA